MPTEGQTPDIDIAPAIYQLPLEESYRLQLEACEDYYRTQLDCQFELDKWRNKALEQKAIFEAQSAICKERKATNKILESVNQLLRKSLNAYEAALQKIVDIDDNA